MINNSLKMLIHACAFVTTCSSTHGTSIFMYAQKPAQVRIVILANILAQDVSQAETLIAIECSMGSNFSRAWLFVKLAEQLCTPDVNH